MKILLIGEYSNVHWTLAQGLRSLGHTVCVVSNGDFWKDYKCDISLVRNYTKLGGLNYLIKAYTLLPQLRGYDIVQLINPMFLELKAERIVPIYRYLKKHNKKIFLGAYGMDAYWVEACTSTPYMFRYSDFNIGNNRISNRYLAEQEADWKETPKARLNKEIAGSCNGIIAGLYEYYAAYNDRHSNKLTYIPFPVEPDNSVTQYYNNMRKIRFFIGIQKERSIYKGTDIMLRALERIAHNHPKECEILKAESVPFEQYSKMINDCDILLDQLYGYSPLTAKQIDHYIDMYLGIISLDSVCVIVDNEDNLVGVGISMPSLSRALQKSKGKMFPMGWLPLLKALRFDASNIVDLMLVAVKPEYQGKGVNALLFEYMIPRYNKHGYKYAESNPELETNANVQSQWGYFNYEQHKRRRSFRKKL